MLNENYNIISRDGILYYKCNEIRKNGKVCLFETRSKKYFKNHIEDFHKCYYCNFIFKDGTKCQKKCGSKDVLKRHKKRHKKKKKKKPYYCDLCEFNSVQSSTLFQHKQNIHHINLIWYYCDFVYENGDKCDHKSKQKSDMKKHKQNIHNIDIKWQFCDFVDEKGVKCSMKFKEKGTLKQHKQNIHNIGVKWHFCDFVNENGVKCDMKFKQKSILNSHQRNKHDIGDLVCDICYGKCGSLTKFKYNNTNIESCRRCYHKTTGYKCRAEKKMVEYLEKNYNQPILKKDSRVNNDSCLLYRPDVLYAGPKRAIIVECDEKQHKWNPNYSCDESRMLSLYDEFQGKELVFIRWNPDSYTPPTGYKKHKREERLSNLVTVLKNLENKKLETKIYVIYMYYDEDSTLLAQNIKYEILF